MKETLIKKINKWTILYLVIIKKLSITYTDMNSITKGKCPLGACNGEGEYIIHHTCSNGNDLDMYPATMCDCSREFNSLRGLRIHKACWCK